MGREIIFLHFGQAGVQMGSALWELFCIEHRLSSEGSLVYNGPGDELTSAENIGAFFYEGYKSWTPRAVMVDLEPTVIDEIRTGPYRKLWRPCCLVTGKEDAANNYGRGNCTIGKLKMDETMDSIRKLAEECSNVAAFETVHSHSGGTGSGMTTLVIDQLCDEYGKKFKFSTSVFPSSMYSQSTVDPYNAILHAHSTIETLDCDILIDNQTMFERCTKNLGIYQPSYTDINRLLAQMLSSVFMSHRFIYYGSQHCDTTELLTNLIPYPRIHFPSLFYAPLVSHHQMEHDAMTISELTRFVFSEDAQTIDFPCKENAYISCAMLYRGANSPKQIYDALQLVKGTPSVGARFVDWCPTGFKIGLNTFPSATFPNSPLAETPRSVCMLAGNLGMRHAWHRNNLKFDILFSRRSFVHWFIGEGIEESEFVEARDDLAYLEQDYAELMSETIQAVEMVEPPMQDVQQSPIQLSVRSSSSVDADNNNSRGSTNQESEEILKQIRQSNNANTRWSHEHNYDGRAMDTRKPSVWKYGDTDLVDWEVPRERSGKPSRSSNGHSSHHLRAISQEPHENRFLVRSETEGEWPRLPPDGHAKVHQEDPRIDGVKSGIENYSISANESGISHRQAHRSHGCDHSSYEYKSTDVISNISELRTTEVSKPSGPRGFNRNNARHSQDSNDTGFYPTEPLVRQSDGPLSSLGDSITPPPVPPPRQIEQRGVTPSSVSHQTATCEQAERKKKTDHHSRCRRHDRQRLIRINADDMMIEGFHTSSMWSVASTASYIGRNSSTPADEIIQLTETELVQSIVDDQLSTDVSCVVECFDVNTEDNIQSRTGSATSGLGSMSNVASVVESTVHGQESGELVGTDGGPVEMGPISAPGGGYFDQPVVQYNAHYHHPTGQIHHRHRKHHRHSHHSRKQYLSVPDQLQASEELMKSSRGTSDTRRGCKYSGNKQCVVNETGDRCLDSSTDVRTSFEGTQCWSTPVVDERPVYEVSVTENDDDRAVTPILSAWSTQDRRIPTFNVAHY